MKRYENYKDSGVAWLGEVPSHWEVKRGRFSFNVLSGYPANSDNFTNDESAFPLIRIRDIYSTTTETRYNGFVPETHIIHKGDVLVGMDGDFNVAVWKGDDALLNQRVCKITASEKCTNKFFYYVLPYLLKTINDVTYSTTVKHLSTFDLTSSAFPIPPLAEQEAIAAYLDAKCEAIDGMVEKIEEKISLFQRLRRAIIKKSCTVIKEYREMPLRHVFHFRNGYTPSKLVPEFWENGTIPWFRMEDIRTNGRILSDSIQHITPQAVKGELFKKNSFILATTATIGEHAWLIADSLANQQFTNLSIRKSLGVVDYRFFFYLLFEIDEFCKESCHVSTFPSVNTDELKAFKVKIPPLAEQQAIADYLDRKCGKIDDLVAKYEKQKELLARYKKSLIAQVVTGQRRVC